MDRVNKLVQLLLLMLSQRARLLVATREIDVHVGGHCGAVSAATGKLVCSSSELCEGDCSGAVVADSVRGEARA